MNMAAYSECIRALLRELTLEEKVSLVADAAAPVLPEQTHVGTASNGKSKENI